jgi:hypothetical protein
VKRILSWILMLALFVSGAPLAAQTSSTGGRTSADYWRRYTEKLPIGSTIKVRTSDGKRITAVLAIVDESGITVELKTRRPEEPRLIPFDELRQIELKQNGSSRAKAAAIGVGVGVASFFAGWLLLFVAYGD